MPSLYVAALLLFCVSATETFAGVGQQNSTSSEVKRVCRGTNFELAHYERTRERYEFYKSHFNECTHVEGNLEIVFLGSYDLQFLSSIREVTGYVLLIANYAKSIPLTNLRVIRGNTLFQHESKFYALYVALNYDPDSDDGLRELQFTSLREILSGSVFLFDNNQLCHEDSIDWSEIMAGKNAELFYKARDPEQNSRKCEECDDRCEVKGQKRCWGSGPLMCQKVRSSECSPQCDGFCFGPLPNQCCHPECSAGCNGPTNRDCWSCRHFHDEGSCTSRCPPQFLYSHSEFKHVPNPRAKLAYGNTCVSKCPPHLNADNGACVQDCAPGKRLGNGGRCVECAGPCPKTCKMDLKEDFVHMGNIERYRGCTVVQGRIKILDTTFTGDPYYKVGPLPIEALSIFETVREVTEFVQIQANHPDFKDLSFFKNLQIIYGKKLDRGRASLQISQTSLQSLGLMSLQRIKNGHVLIANNSQLCFPSLVDWRNFFGHHNQNAIVQYNRDAQECEQSNERCNDQCSKEGCWGKEDYHCLSCKSFVFNGRCVPSCSFQTGVYQRNESTCGECHDQCKTGCNGPGSEQCQECKHFRDGPYCVAACPTFKYPDRWASCQPCHELCDTEFGCTGPGNHVGVDGCNACQLHYPSDSLNSSSDFICWPPESGCSKDFYASSLSTFINSSKTFPRKEERKLINLQVCLKCHAQCDGCFGPGSFSCASCSSFTQAGRCVEKCSDDHYHEELSLNCLKCDPKCLTCSGTAYNCSSCKHYILPLDEPSEHHNFMCVEKCPDVLPYKIAKRNSRGDVESFCSVHSEEFVSRRKWTAFVIFPSLILIALGFIVMLLSKKKKSFKEQESRLIQSVASFEPVAPSNIQPDMSTLRLTRQSELRIGGVIGAGAFGTVYQGVWLPEDGIPCQKLMVAIKVLIEGAEDSGNREILDEARIMASVDHPCCVKILCLCLSPSIMLVTELMRHGCMLDFVRARGSYLGSSTLLLWSWQIAQGMKFLEDKGIVHRDLAARNVLVQSLKQVKITDFGLAKLLNFEKGPPHLSKSQTRMPIKWLAYESIVSQTFTHQSDVWSFGVTIWELLTFGKRPYGSTNAMDTVVLLEKGERLAQPAVCNTELYILLFKCWLFDPKERPTFSDLSETFKDMNIHPANYISLPHQGKYDELLTSDEGYRSLRPSDQTEGGVCQHFTPDESKFPFYINGETQKPQYKNLSCDRGSNRVKYSNLSGYLKDFHGTTNGAEANGSYCNTIPQVDPSSNSHQFQQKTSFEVSMNFSKGRIYYDCNISRQPSQLGSSVFV